MSRVYPCGIMFVAERLVHHAPPIDSPVTGEQPWKVHPSGRTLTRMLQANSRGVLTFTFTETWRINTICCLGPCILEQAIIHPFVVYPYPEHRQSEGTLFVLVDKILEPGCAMTIWVVCKPDLFMLDGDELGAESRPAYFDGKGGVHVE